MKIRNSILLLLALLVPMTGFAGAIFYDITNLSGNDWRYEYRLSGFQFQAGEGFTIFFDESLFEDLRNVSVPGDWDPLLSQPDSFFQVAGFLDALATVNQPSNQTFGIDFTYLGAGTPGAQPFEAYSTNPDFVVFDSGLTEMVPEPDAILLVGGGLALLIGFGRRTRLAAISTKGGAR